MKTDKLFYRLFQELPQIFFELIGESNVDASAYEFNVLTPQVGASQCLALSRVPLPRRQGSKNEIHRFGFATILRIFGCDLTVIRHSYLEVV